ncbi:hypothetical protein [Halodesulfovibrio spirochaetisodalis]|uniref:Uncharacterized protein n=1 Tax=Halodesulfovibrio spirochaetisodalis TaxID=1560234 RepID=A0A1B7XMP8_9BACT|nr:hypothetical protein [Halodesulfovibrio spirochaetisodalis]OBQ56788.1 hypothetical protein SP90_01545 [Halodesulfovibrio spirochaetisodalis]
MHKLLELAALAIIFTICAKLDDKSYGTFVQNIAYSTASACIFYLVFNTIPSGIQTFRRTKKYITNIVKLFRCCTAFDRYLTIVDDNVFIGNDGGHSTQFFKINSADATPYLFKGTINRRGYGHPNEVTIKLCEAMLEIINEIERLEIRINPEVVACLNKIRDRIEYQINSPKGQKQPQNFRSFAWRRMEEIYSILSSHLFFNYLLHNEAKENQLKFSIKS